MIGQRLRRLATQLCFLGIIFFHILISRKIFPDGPDILDHFAPLEIHSFETHIWNAYRAWFPSSI